MKIRSSQLQSSKVGVGGNEDDDNEPSIIAQIIPIRESPSGNTATSIKRSGKSNIGKDYASEDIKGVDDIIPPWQTPSCPSRASDDGKQRSKDNVAKDIKGAVSEIPPFQPSFRPSRVSDYGRTEAQKENPPKFIVIDDNEIEEEAFRQEVALPYQPHYHNVPITVQELDHVSSDPYTTATVIGGEKHASEDRISLSVSSNARRQGQDLVVAIPTEDAMITEIEVCIIRQTESQRCDCQKVNHILPQTTRAQVVAPVESQTNQIDLVSRNKLEEIAVQPQQQQQQDKKKAAVHDTYLLPSDTYHETKQKLLYLPATLQRASPKNVPRLCWLLGTLLLFVSRRVWNGSSSCDDMAKRR